VAALVAAQVAGAGDGDADGEPLVHAVHDVSGGGLATALAEMAAAAGTGCTLELDDAAELFTEVPSRFVVAAADPDELCRLAVANGIPAAVLGPAGGARFTLGALVDLPVEALREAHEGNLALALGEP
jgi:phosphoribosylformylglycinamidine synthase